MRTILALVLFGTLVACAGEIENEPADKTASGQPSEDEAADVAMDAAESKESKEPKEPKKAKASACASTEGECTLGATQSCALGCRQVCICSKGRPAWGPEIFETTGSSTPLVLSFDDARVVFRADATGTFDLTRKGISLGGDWPTAATPWLALDRDGNGTIDDGGELFGSATKLEAGGYARNGFEALRELDANGDGVFDARDPAFGALVVWADRNLDRQSTPNELVSLASTGVRAIDLHDRRELRCDDRNNCEGERSSFTAADGRRGTVIDVYIPAR